MDVVESLDIIDSLKKNFTSDSGFLAFNGKEIYVKEFKDPNSRRLVDLSYIHSFKKYRYTTDNLFMNTFNNILSDTSVEKFRAALVRPKLETVFRSQSEIIFTKKIEEFLYAINEQGLLYKYDVVKTKEVYEIDISRLFFDVFETVINGTDISDICYDDGDLYIATYKNGIFLLNEDTRSLKRVILEPNVSHIAILGDSILCFSDMLHVYSIETYSRTEKINFYKSEKIMKVLDVGNKIFVVGKSIGVYATDHALHLLELDDLGSVVLSDNKVAKNPSFNRYDIQWANADNEHVYVSGLHGTDAFLWEYNIEDPIKFRQIDINNFHAKSVISVEKYYENFVIYAKEHVVVVKDKNIRSNISVPDIVKEVIYSNGQYFFRSATDLVRIAPIEYSSENKVTVKADSLKDCNELEICVFNGEPKMTFLTESGERITPAFTIKHKNIMFSRIPVPADASEVKIILDNIQDNIESVVIKRNRIFYR